MKDLLLLKAMKIDKQDITDAFLWVAENQSYVFSEKDIQELEQLQSEEYDFDSMMDWLKDHEHIRDCVRYKHQEIMRSKNTGE
jgi:hypothetical protein